MLNQLSNWYAASQYFLPFQYLKYFGLTKLPVQNFFAQQSQNQASKRPEILHQKLNRAQIEYFFFRFSSVRDWQNYRRYIIIIIVYFFIVMIMIIIIIIIIIIIYYRYYYHCYYY